MRAMLAIAGALMLAAQETKPAAPQNPPRDPRAASAPGTGSIAGRITIDGTDDPIRWATITVSQPQQQIVLSTSADADGRYRFDALPPGNYTLRGTKGGFVSMPYGATRYRDPPAPIQVDAGVVTANLKLPRAGAIEGRVLSPLGEPMQDVTVQALRVGYDATGRRVLRVGLSSRSDDLGNFRLHTIPPGQYIVEAAPLSLAQLVQSETRDVSESLRTYFPGTLRLSDAQLVHVASARTSTANFSVTAGTASKLLGTIVDSQGQPAKGASLMLRSIDGGGDVAALNLPPATSAFGFLNVQPGEYLLVVTVRGDGIAPEFAVRRVSISGGDVTEPQIRTTPGSTLEGIVEIESEPGTARPAALAVIAHNTAFPGLIADPNRPSLPARVGPDSRFKFTNLVGPRLFRVPLKAPWAVKAVRLDDRDVADVPLDLSGSYDRTRSAQSDPGVLRIVLTDRTGSISGSSPVSSVAGPFDARAQVVVFSEDEQRWGFESRFTKIAEIDRGGRFAVHGLLPGRYLVAAVGDLEPGAWGDPDVLRELKTSAVAVVVVEGKDSPLTLAAGRSR
jgi:hypothetical protein